MKHSWEDLTNNIQDYIASLNFGYRTELRDKKVEYINAYAQVCPEEGMLGLTS